MPRGYMPALQLPQAPSIEKDALNSGWWEFDQIWRIYPAQFTVVTGLPGDGKSTFIINLAIRLWREHRVRPMFYVPENEQRFVALLRTIWGDQDGFEEFAGKECFVQSSMPDEYDDQPHDLRWVLDRAAMAAKHDECGLIVIDPWNELEHAKAREQPMTDYIRECLMYLKQFTRAYLASVILVAHPTKAVAENDGRTPRLSDIEGSMSWYNKCDNGLIVERDFQKNSTKVISAKVRYAPGAGKVGCCYFTVDPQTGIFTPQYGAVT